MRSIVCAQLAATLPRRLHNLLDECEIGRGLRQHVGARADHQHPPDLVRRRSRPLSTVNGATTACLRMRSVTDSRWFTRVTASAADTSS